MPGPARTVVTKRELAKNKKEQRDLVKGKRPDDGQAERLGGRTAKAEGRKRPGFPFTESAGGLFHASVPSGIYLLLGHSWR